MIECIQNNIAKSLLLVFISINHRRIVTRFQDKHRNIIVEAGRACKYAQLVEEQLKKLVWRKLVVLLEQGNKALFPKEVTRGIRGFRDAVGIEKENIVRAEVTLFFFEVDIGLDSENQPLGVERDNDAEVAVPQQGAVMPGAGVFEEPLFIVVADVEHGDEQFSAGQVFEEEMIDLVHHVARRGIAIGLGAYECARFSH